MLSNFNRLPPRVRAERAPAVGPHRLRGNRRPLLRHPRQHGVHRTAGTPNSLADVCLGPDGERGGLKE